MRKIVKAACAALLFFILPAAPGFTQNLKLDDLKNCFSATNYPECLFEMVESKGFYRLDKQYLENCDRVVYAYVKNQRPVMFVNPVTCFRTHTSEIYPLKVKSELELQFQKAGRVQFEALSARIRKSCKALPAANTSDPGKKINLRAYRHQASGITFVIVDDAPVGFIYFLK